MSDIVELIVQLRAEIERLGGLVKAAEAQEWKELQTARAEIERLKAALRYARDCASGHVDNKCFDCRELVAYIDAALEDAVLAPPNKQPAGDLYCEHRAALEEKK